MRMKDFLWFVLCFLVSGSVVGADLVVSAASSLATALSELKPVFEVQYPGYEVSYNYGASGSLARQIEAGAPVDVYISASAIQMNQLEAEGFILPGMRLNLLSNEIVLVVPKKSSFHLKNFSDLVRVGKIGIGDPAFVPAGQYAVQTLKYLDLMGALNQKLIYGQDVRQVLEYVEREEVDAGIVFVTDARISSGNVRILMAAPAGSHAAIIYPAAIMKNSGHSGAAEKFVSFLSGPEGKKVFEKYGFRMLQNNTPYPISLRRNP